MTIASSVDLIYKHMVHHDYFSKPLQDLKLPNPALSSTADNEEPVLVCDAYYNSFKTFKGKVFLMGHYEFVIGSLSNWADRLLDIMDAGDYIGAIKLATRYYLGMEDVVAVGLPDNEKDRHDIVHKNLPDMITASLKYTFKEGPFSMETWALSEPLKTLTNVCLEVVVALQPDHELLEEIYEHFEASGAQMVFFQQLVPLIHQGDITYLTPRIFKDLILNYSKTPELSQQLEELICSLDTSTLDVDLAISLCKEFHLRDTLIYIWNHSLGDFVAPLVDTIQMIQQLAQRSEFVGNHDFEDNDNNSPSDIAEEINSVFPYISYISTGRIYPTGSLFPSPQTSISAKSQLYYFLFSSGIIKWPPVYGPKIATQSNPDDEPIFPYATALIFYDPENFFAALNEAFEDSFLNEDTGLEQQQLESNSFDFKFDYRSFNRQYIVNVLLQILSNEPEDSEVLRSFDIFLARNFPKYSQFIILSGTTLSNLLKRLCHYKGPELEEEIELAVESLLSVYKPHDLDTWIAIFYEVEFYTVLQFLFKSEKQYAKYLEVSFVKQKKSGGGVDEKLLDIVEECLEKSSNKDRTTTENLIVANFQEICYADCKRTVSIITRLSPRLNEHIIGLDSDPELQYQYLKFLFEYTTKSNLDALPGKRTRHLYISLLSKYNKPDEIYDFVTKIAIRSDDLDISVVSKDLEACGAIDSLIILLRRQDRVSEALDKSIEHLKLMSKKDGPGIEDELKKYVQIAIDICRGKVVELPKSKKKSSSPPTTTREKLWISLLDSLVDLSKVANDGGRDDDLFRKLLQEALSSLLDHSDKTNNAEHQSTIIRICKSLLSSPSSAPRKIGSMRPILNDLFAAYRYQYMLTNLARQLLDADAYSSLKELLAERLKGWRVPKSGECEGCGRKIFGVGIDADYLYAQWEHSKLQQLSRELNVPDPEESSKSLKGKGKSKDQGLKGVPVAEPSPETNKEMPDDILVVFKCRHSYHLGCLARLGETNLNDLKCIMGD